MIISFDTSNYTTSLAIVDKGDIIYDLRQLVKVKAGKQGIRQSDAFFQHVQMLRQWLAEYLPSVRKSLSAVACSTRPRSLAGSYMPVFTAGQSMAETVAAALAVPLFSCSHQDGHFYSALYGHAQLEGCLFLHLSGGTTECHSVTRRADDWQFEEVAATTDINFGQLIDRIGVACGLSFPCGAAMDAARHPTHQPLQAPAFKLKSNFNLSGYENYFKNLLAKGFDCTVVYQHLFETIADILVTLIDYYAAQAKQKIILLAGGVAENTYIRNYLRQYYQDKAMDIYLAQPAMSRDNAVGVALYAADKLKSG